MQSSLRDHKNLEVDPEFDETSEEKSKRGSHETLSWSKAEPQQHFGPLVIDPGMFWKGGYNSRDGTRSKCELSSPSRLERKDYWDPVCPPWIKTESPEPKTVNLYNHIKSWVGPKWAEFTLRKSFSAVFFAVSSTSGSEVHTVCEAFSFFLSLNHQKLT